LLFTQALAQSPFDERAHWGYSNTLWKQGSKTKAIEHMSEAYRLSGRNPDYAVQLGEMHLELGQCDLAKQLALDVLSANRGHANAWALLGDVHDRQSDWPSALECYHHALILRGDFPKVQFSIAEIYRTTGRPERALATLDHMADLHVAVVDSPEHLLLRGLVYADLNRTREASELLAKCSERLTPEEWEKQLQVVEGQVRCADLVQARMAMGRIPESYASAGKVSYWQNKLNDDFLRLANATSPLGSSNPPAVHGLDSVIAPSFSATTQTPFAATAQPDISTMPQRNRIENSNGQIISEAFSNPGDRPLDSNPSIKNSYLTEPPKMPRILR
jgi:tetratricopeptide (TPR) repeat protein